MKVGVDNKKVNMVETGLADNLKISWLMCESKITMHGDELMLLTGAMQENEMIFFFFRNRR